MNLWVGFQLYDHICFEKIDFFLLFFPVAAQLQEKQQEEIIFLKQTSIL